MDPPDRQHHNRSRTSLSDRLNSLLTDSQRSSLESTQSTSERGEANTMRAAVRSEGVAGRLNGQSSRHGQTRSLKSKSSTAGSVHSIAVPVLRWFGQDSEDQAAPSTSRIAHESHLNPSTLLKEAINEEIFHPPNRTFHLQRPPPVHIPPHISSRASLHHTPFLEPLTRPSLPTSSVTYTTSFYDNFAPENSAKSSGFRISQSPPTRTSISSLKSLRGLHTSSASESERGTSPSKKPSSWFSWLDHQELLDESDQGGVIEGEAAHIRKKYKSPLNPVVFCHGLLGFDSVQIGPSIAPLEVTHWRGIKEVLEANGIEVLITRVPATSSPAERAKVLEAKISETYPGRAVHLIGHSMGGLDCRYLTSHLKHRTFRVLSITTIATPHRGSSFADYFLSTIGKDRMPSVVSLLDLLPNGGGDGKAFESLTVESMRRFNEETPDIEGVQYFSWGAQFEPGLLDTFRWPWSVILEKEGPNDGLVSVESAKWGTYLGTLEDVNHLDLVGWINTARYKWAEFTGREIKFKPATFYLGVADHLARVVERQGKEHSEDSKGGKGAEGTHAGEGVSTVEGVEHQRPASASSSSS